MGKTLSGKTALVTGASRGIGRAIAEKLASEGATVAVHYGKNGKAAAEVVEKIKAGGGDAFAVGTDLAEKGAATKLFATFDAELAKRGKTRFDILVNNAGIAPFVGFADTTEAILDEIYTVNFRSLFFITQEAVKRLDDGGRIISTSTGAVRTPLRTRGGVLCAQGADRQSDKDACGRSRSAQHHRQCGRAGRDRNRHGGGLRQQRGGAGVRQEQAGAQAHRHSRRGGGRRQHFSQVPRPVG